MGQREQTYKHNKFPTRFHSTVCHSSTKNNVQSHNPLKGPYFTLSLKQWTKHYRSNTIPWNDKVTIDVKGIPPHAFYPQTLIPLLSPYCNIQTSLFDKESGTCTLDAFAASIQFIPNRAHVGLLDKGHPGVTIYAFSVSFYIKAYTQASNDAAANSDLAKEFNSNRDVLDEVYAEQFQLQQELERPINQAIDDETDSSEYDKYENKISPDRRSYESMSTDLSDHEPKEWRSLIQSKYLYSISSVINNHQLFESSISELFVKLFSILNLRCFDCL